MEEKPKTRNKKYDVVVGIIAMSIVTLLGLVLSYSWAVNVHSENEIVNAETTGDLKLIYRDCSSSDATCANISKDLAPGESVEKVFEVTNDSVRDLNFGLYFRNLLNTFKNSDLVYKLENVTKNETIINEKAIKYSESTINDVVLAPNIEIAANSTNQYRLTVTFLNKDRDQNDNLNATYNLKLGIGDTSLLNGTDTLLFKANGSSITDYNSGNKGEMYTFDHPAAEQTEALTDYRYIGNTPNNYVTFNDETWRIIGVFTVENESGQKEQRIKIIRDESLGNMTWDMKSDGTRSNEWPTSSLSTMLNGDYINKGSSFDYIWYSGSISTPTSNTTTINGLGSAAQNQISAVKWYLGGNNTSLVGGSDYYSFERGTTVYTGRSTNVIAKVGLMYPSDYVYTYALGVDNTCYSDGYNCQTSASGTPSAGWLYKSSFSQQTITPNSRHTIYAFGVTTVGYVINGSSVNTYSGVRPCLYLRSDIKITGGDGSSGNPYVLGK